MKGTSISETPTVHPVTRVIHTVQKNFVPIMVALLVATMITGMVLSHVTTNVLLLSSLESAALIIGIFSPQISWNPQTKKIDASVGLKSLGMSVTARGSSEGPSATTTAPPPPTQERPVYPYGLYKR